MFIYVFTLTSMFLYNYEVNHAFHTTTKMSQTEKKEKWRPFI